MLGEEKSEGFFRPVHVRARSELSDVEWQAFQRQSCGRRRVQWAFRLAALQELNLQQPFSQGKSGADAARAKEEGNKEFARGNTARALQLYSQSILRQPSACDEDRRALSIALGNRSAALFRLGRWALALQDISQALDSGFPEDLRYKLLDRRARVLLQLGRPQQAREAAGQALQALPISQLAPEKKRQWGADIQQLLHTIDKAKAQAETASSPGSRTVGSLGAGPPQPPALTGGPHPQLLSASRLLQLRRSPEEGRFVAAKQPLRPGDTLLVEKAYASVLLGDRGRTHCAACFLGLMAPIPCEQCCNVLFCSPECRAEAMATWHRYECPIQDLLMASGMSLTCFLSLRMLTQTSLEALRTLQLTPEPAEGLAPGAKYDGSSYSSVFRLVSHEERRSPEDMFHRCLMAAFLLRCLRLTTYFSGTPDDAQEGPELSPGEAFVGWLLLHNLQVLQFNAHEVAEFQMPGGKGQVDGAQSVLLGAGIFPTLSLFNHSCEPSIVRYFCRDTVVVRAVRNMAAGEMVAENYGPVYTQAPLEERRTTLLEQYWFTCQCRACLEDWPRFSQMKGDALRFRCSNPKCGLALGSGSSGSASEAASEVVLSCASCGRSTSVLKGLLALQQTESLFSSGCRLLAQGKVQEALPLFCKNLNLLDQVLVPPYRDYHLCQEALRKCLLALGNVRIAAFSPQDRQ